MPEPHPSLLHRAAIALGSNLPSKFGGPAENIDEAVEQIRGLGRIVSVSSYIDTAPEMYLDQPEFVNAALLLETLLSPVELLRTLLAIEVAMGRVRQGIPAKGPRLIDLDLIFFGSEVVQTAELTLPHPGMAERVFVLNPLAEIAGDWVHPISHLTVAQMLASLQPAG